MMRVEKARYFLGMGIILVEDDGIVPMPEACRDRARAPNGDHRGGGPHERGVSATPLGRPRNGLRSLDLVSLRKSVATWKLHSASRFVASIIEE
jgi:hypothetical protein